MRRLPGKTVALAATVLALGLTAGVAIAVGGGPSGAGAADHLDAPGLTPPGGDVRLDLTDIYAFRAAGGRTALVLNVNGFSKAGQQATFATGVPSVAATERVSYNLHIDNNGDARDDIVLGVTFGNPNGQGVQKLQVRRNGKVILNGKTSAFGKVVVNKRKDIRAFAGMRDDPFFFDLQGFLNILSSQPGKSFLGCTSARPDAFAGANVSSIVLELKPSLLTRKGSSKIGVWASTTMGADQIDRMGRPAIATVFIPNNPFEPVGSEPSLKNTYNHGVPSEDQAKFRSEIVDTLTTLYSLNDAAGDDKSDDATKINGLADVLLPDILTFDTKSSQGFLNGRRPADDVIDAELPLITEGAVKTDCVDANDEAFPGGFPYLAKPHA
ncbi:MAG: hypothetical protein V7645_76 [Actinomycetota bacterium]